MLFRFRLCVLEKSVRRMYGVGCSRTLHSNKAHHWSHVYNVYIDKNFLSISVMCVEEDNLFAPKAPHIHKWHTIRVRLIETRNIHTTHTEAAAAAAAAQVTK